MTSPHSIPEFFAREPLVDDWPSLFHPIWFPDMETACEAPEQASRYVVRLACWGMPSQLFADRISDLSDLAATYVEAWGWVTSASARWNAADQRIELDFLCEEDEPGFPDSTAEVMADYVDRGVIATMTDPETGLLVCSSGQTAIVKVFVPDAATT